MTNTNAPEAGVDRMLAENGAYYLVGYSSPARADEGKRHQSRYERKSLMSTSEPVKGTYPCVRRPSPRHHPRASTRSLASPSRPGGGKVYRLPLPRELSPGVYRLIVETTLERTRVVRELMFRIVSAP